MNKSQEALCHKSFEKKGLKVQLVKKRFCMDTICHLHCRESVFGIFWMIDEGNMLYFRWCCLYGVSVAVLRVYSSNFVFLWVPKPIFASENWLLSQCSRKSLWQFHQITVIHHLLHVYCANASCWLTSQVTSAQVCDLTLMAGGLHCPGGPAAVLISTDSEYGPY